MLGGVLPTFAQMSTTTVSESKALTLVIKGSNRGEMTAGDVINLDADIYNNTPNEVQLNFKRTHLNIPLNWTSSICFGITCYAPKTDSLKSDAAFTLPAGTEPVNFHLSLYCPPGSFPDSVVDYIKFFIQDGSEADTVSSIFIGYLGGLASVGQTNELTNSQPEIISIYPSPLTNGSSVRVKINSPYETDVKYSIFDEGGREIAFGTIPNRLVRGYNICEVSKLNSLANGNYFMKFIFNDGSITKYTFQIVR